MLRHSINHTFARRNVHPHQTSLHHVIRIAIRTKLHHERQQTVQDRLLHIHLPAELPITHPLFPHLDQLLHAPSAVRVLRGGSKLRPAGAQLRVSASRHPHKSAPLVVGAHLHQLLEEVVAEGIGHQLVHLRAQLAVQQLHQHQALMGQGVLQVTMADGEKGWLPAACLVGCHAEELPAVIFDFLPDGGHVRWFGVVIDLVGWALAFGAALALAPRGALLALSAFLLWRSHHGGGAAMGIHGDGGGSTHHVGVIGGHAVSLLIHVRYRRSVVTHGNARIALGRHLFFVVVPIVKIVPVRGTTIHVAVVLACVGIREGRGTGRPVIVIKWIIISWDSFLNIFRLIGILRSMQRFKLSHCSSKQKSC